jgi:sec-independent protein translocase protein TatB
MFDIGWMEMMVIAIVMIVIIGPKELPGVLHTMGRWIGRVRAMARSFQDSIEEMAHESGLDDVRREVDSITDYDIGGSIQNTIDPGGEMRKELTEDVTVDAPKAAEEAAPSEDGKSKKKKTRKTAEAESADATPPAAKDGKGRDRSPSEAAGTAENKS